VYPLRRPCLFFCSGRLQHLCFLPSAAACQEESMHCEPACARIGEVTERLPLSCGGIDPMKRSCQKKAAVSLLCGLLACSAVLLPACSRSRQRAELIVHAQQEASRRNDGRQAFPSPDWDGKDASPPWLSMRCTASTGFFRSGRACTSAAVSGDVTGFTLYVESAPRESQRSGWPAEAPGKWNLVPWAVNGVQYVSS